MNHASPLYHGDAFKVVQAACGFKGKLALVFQCYLDDSGTSGMPVLTVAGFVAHIDEWQRIEPIANAILNQCQVPVFHAKDFHDTKGCFGGWSRVRKRSFVQQLFPALGNNLFAVSFSVKIQEFQRLKEDKSSHHSMSAYGLCFSAIMMRLLFQTSFRHEIRKEGLLFVVESGNNNNAEIEQAFHKTANETAFEGCLKSISFVPKASCRAIQLADYWAFYTRRLISDLDRQHGKFKEAVPLPKNFYTDAIYRQFQYWQHFGNDFSDVVKLPTSVKKMNNLNEIEASLREASSKLK